jgi:hypothetical protein
MMPSTSVQKIMRNIIYSELCKRKKKNYRSEAVYSESFENVQIFLDLQFLCSPEYKLFHVDIFQGYVILSCQHLEFFRIFLKL